MHRMLFFLVGLSLPAVALAQPASSGPAWTEAESWAWTKMSAGAPADFTAHCKAAAPSCLDLRGGVLAQMLTQPPWANGLHSSGVRIIGAVLTGGLDLANARIGVPMILSDGRIDGDLGLARARLDNVFVLNGMKITGGVDGAGLVSQDDVTISTSFVGGQLTLSRAKVDGSVDLSDSRFGKAVILRGARLTQNLQATNAHFNAPADDASSSGDGGPQAGLDVRAATIGGDADLTGAQIAGDADLSTATITRDLSVQKTNIGGTLRLTGATISDTLHAEDARIGGRLVALGMHVGGDLMLDRSTISGDADLSAATISRGLWMQNADFASTVTLVGTQIENTLHVKDAKIAGRLTAMALHVGGDVLLGGATLGQGADFSGATINGSFNVDTDTKWPARFDATEPGRAPPTLNLENAHLGAISDGEPNGDPCESLGWPAGQSLGLEGLMYNQLPVGRDVCAWRNFLLKDPSFSPQPYKQMVAVMVTHGDDQSAAAIQLSGRNREVVSAWQGGEHLQAILRALSGVLLGYGINPYGAVVIIWFIVLAAIAFWLLRRSKGAEGKSRLWLMGASLTRMLPGIELNKEFTNFFDEANADNKKLSSFQFYALSVLVLLSWTLGLFFTASVTGLIQH